MHEIGVEFSDDDYESLISTYTNTGEKNWMEATVTIDGVTYEDAGMRLKGNSSLAGLRGNGGGVGDSSADDPASLPWLIRLDHYVDGQNHEGVTELVVRSNMTETALNEALALDLLAEAGLAAQAAVSVSFSVNAGEPTLRLVVENPEDTWMAAAFDETGALYKAESTGDWSYRGEDPEAYDEVFDQEAGDDNADLTPLIEFLDFVNNSDDESFASELADRLDVEAFATYLAFEDLIDNFDDIDGPGNNAYLYYGVESDRFTVVAWDHNLAFGAMGARAGGPALGTHPEMPSPPGGADGFARAPGGAGPAGGPAGGTNVLVERFLAVDSFEAMYDDALTELQESLIDSGLAQQLLDARIAILEGQASNLVTPDTVQEDAEVISDLLTDGSLTL